MNFTIRLETEADYKNTENMVREAFWNVHVPGCDEHYLMHSMRHTADFIPQLNFVAEYNGEIIGNIVYTHAFMKANESQTCRVLTFGPLSVLPKYQKQGVGKALIAHSVLQAKQLGYKAVLIYGNPAYYSKHGFLPCKHFNITSPDGSFPMGLQALELEPGWLTDKGGAFFTSAVYEIDPAKAEAFDKTFPPKEKAVTPSQKEFQQIVSTVL